MKNAKKYFITALLIWMASLSPCMDKIAWNNYLTGYNVILFIIMKFIYPIVIGILLFASDITRLTIKKSLFCIVCNLIFIVIVWKYTLGGIAMYNLLLIGIMISQIVCTFVKEKS